VCQLPKRQPGMLLVPKTHTHTHAQTHTHTHAHTHTRTHTNTDKPRGTTLIPKHRVTFKFERISDGGNTHTYIHTQTIAPHLRFCSWLRARRSSDCGGAGRHCSYCCTAHSSVCSGGGSGLLINFVGPALLLQDSSSLFLFCCAQ